MHRHLPERWDVDEAWYFVTVVTRKRHPFFKSRKACRLLKDVCKYVHDKHPYRLGALVIMPDHWNALIKPEQKEVIENVVGSIKMRAFHASRKNSEAILWQPRFMDHRVRDESDYFQHLEYMRVNPCKHGYIENERETWDWWFVHENPFG